MFFCHSNRRLALTLSHQVRAFAETALDTLLKSGASKDGPPPTKRDTEGETSAALDALLTLLPEELAVVSANAPNGPRAPRHPLLTQVLDFQASLVADLVHDRRFHNKDVWHRCVGTYLTPWLSGDVNAAKAFTESVLSHFLAIDQAKYAVKNDDSGEEGELLCDTQFSLAYGALLLLSHTHLRLFRGRRYGILGTNGSGKSTLMRQLRDGKVENFPPQDQLRCVMVEHSLQGENTSLSVIDFVASGTSRLPITGFAACSLPPRQGVVRDPTLQDQGPAHRGRLR